MKKADIGLIGLAVMGENLVLNMERNGFTCAVYNRTVEKVDNFVNGRGKGKNFIGCKSIDELIENVAAPRKIMLMVNIDQIGSSLAPVSQGRKDYLIMLGTQSLAKDKRDLLHRCNIRDGFGMEIALDYYGSRNFTDIFYRLSDQKVFVDNRKPAVMFTSGITMNNNKTWDRTENMDLDIYRKRICLIYHWIEEML